MVKWNVGIDLCRHPAPDRNNANEKEVEAQPGNDKEHTKHNSAGRPSGHEDLKQQNGREEVTYQPNSHHTFSLPDKSRKMLGWHDPKEKKREERHINYGECGIEIPDRAFFLGI